MATARSVAARECFASHCRASGQLAKVNCRVPAIGVPVPLMGTLNLPELALFKKDETRGVAKFAATLYDQRSGALLIRLDCDPEPGPSVGEQFIVCEQRLKHVHLQFEPVRLLGVDGEMHFGLGGYQRELTHHRDYGRERLVAMGVFEPGMQRGQLDLDAR